MLKREDLEARRLLAAAPALALACLDAVKLLEVLIETVVDREGLPGECLTALRAALAAAGVATGPEGDNA